MCVTEFSEKPNQSHKFEKRSKSQIKTQKNKKCVEFGVCLEVRVMCHSSFNAHTRSHIAVLTRFA